MPIRLPNVLRLFPGLVRVFRVRLVVVGRAPVGPVVALRGRAPAARGCGVLSVWWCGFWWCPRVWRARLRLRGGQGRPDHQLRAGGDR